MNQEEKICQLLAEVKALKKENAKYKIQKTYGLVWENEKNKEKIVEDCKTKLPILEWVKDKEIITDKTTPMNLMIEGDNYHVLTCLNYTHKGKIDVIYIDPPYNTGKKDEWRYNDKYVDSEDRFRHSKWLNMMNRRLKLVRNLLANDGVIFISIDDNEQANLKLLCDDIFGEKNFVNQLIWINNLKGRQIGGKFFVKTYEYILVYVKNFDKVYALNCNLEDPLIKSMSDIYKNKEYAVFEDKIGKYVIKNELFNSNSNFNEETRENLVFNIWINFSKKRVLFTDVCDQKIIKNFVLVKPKLNNNGKNKYHAWRWSKNKITKELDDLEFIKNKDTYKIYTKIRDIKSTSIKDIISISGTDNILKNMDLNFNNPKSLKLLKFLINPFNKKDTTILDFFAGSGTTAHAVLQLNKEDGGNRKFILCTNNEGQIAEDVCYPRIKKVIKGYNKNGNGDKVAGLGGNLHYFKADENSFISVESLKNINDQKRLALTLKAGELIAIRENIFDEKEHSDHYQIFADDTRQVAIYFKEDQTQLLKLITELDCNKEKLIYLFSWGKILLSGDDLGYPNITIKDIPEPIINIYQEINR